MPLATSSFICLSASDIQYPPPGSHDENQSSGCTPVLSLRATGPLRPLAACARFCSFGPRRPVPPQGLAVWRGRETRGREAWGDARPARECSMTSRTSRGHRRHRMGRWVGPKKWRLIPESRCGFQLWRGLSFSLSGT